MERRPADLFEDLHAFRCCCRVQMYCTRLFRLPLKQFCRLGTLSAREKERTFVVPTLELVFRGVISAVIFTLNPQLSFVHSKRICWFLTAAAALGMQTCIHPDCDPTLIDICCVGHMIGCWSCLAPSAPTVTLASAAKKQNSTLSRSEFLGSGGQDLPHVPNLIWLDAVWVVG